MPKFLVIDIGNYEVIADSIEEAKAKFRGVLDNPSELSDEEFSKILHDVEYIDGTTSYEEM